MTTAPIVLPSIVCVAPALAEDAVVATDSNDINVVVDQYPSLAYLVPVYNFKDALNAIESQLNQGTREGLQQASQMVNKFVEGGFLSNKNIFRGLCVVYIQEIRYDPASTTQKDAAADKNQRLSYCDAAIDGLVQMQKPLQQLAMDTESNQVSPEILQYFESTKVGLENFLRDIPKLDLEHVQEWINQVGTADANKNGRLDGKELKSLSDEDQELYKLVGDLVLGA